MKRNILKNEALKMAELADYNKRMDQYVEMKYD